jgi:hypothetical protein
MVRDMRRRKHRCRPVIGGGATWGIPEGSRSRREPVAKRWGREALRGSSRPGHTRPSEVLHALRGLRETLQFCTRLRLLPEGLKTTEYRLHGLPELDRIFKDSCIPPTIQQPTDKDPVERFRAMQQPF